MKPRLSAAETTLLDIFGARVRARFGRRLVGLVLFGSRARGEGEVESDLDVLVLIEGMTRDDRRAVVDLGADLSLDHAFVVSPLVADAGTWRGDLPLAAAISREGVPL